MVEIGDMFKELERLAILDVEVGTQLVLNLDGVEGRLSSTMVGWDPGNYLIITTPKMPGIGAKLFKGNGLIARFLQSGIVFGFQSRIISAIHGPFALTFISYPTIVERRELRQFKRIKCNVAATAKVREGEEKLEGKVQDISRGGCRFVFEARTGAGFAVGTAISLDIHLPQQEPPLTYQGTVRSIKKKSGTASMGLEFDEPSPELFTDLGGIIVLPEEVLK